VRVRPDKTLDVWKAPAGAKPQGLAVGPAGVVWVTESGTNQLAAIHGSALDQTFKTGAWPDHIATTTDGWAWFTEYNQGRLGRILLPAT
jgi:streptogramin lyase